MELSHGILMIDRHDFQIRPIRYNWMSSLGFRLRKSLEYLKAVSIPR